MRQDKKLVIGLFGFGVVGEGIYEVLKKTPSLQAAVKKICIRDGSKHRNAPAALFTTDAGDILNDPAINVVVELISDAEAAYAIVCRALQSRKAVVSANKKMIAEHLQELLRLQAAHGVPLLYEAAVCGSIPVLRNLEEYYDNDLLDGFCGIVNGSTNFILSRMYEDRMDYRSALLQAQSLGFAEADPRLDVEGIDAVNKLAIVLLHGYGIIAPPEHLLHIGISRLHAADAALAAEKGQQVKLTAQARKLSGGAVAAFVLPQFVGSDSQLFQVRNEYNGVVLQTAFADKQFLYGKGAGRFPTASAVLSDLSALRYDYRYEYRKLHGSEGNVLTQDFYLRVYVSFEWDSAVDRTDFEWVEAFHCQGDRQYLIGVIHFERLLQSRWLHRKEVSLVVCPDGFVEDVAARKLRRRSLELAGSPYVDRVGVAIDGYVVEEEP